MSWRDDFRRKTVSRSFHSIRHARVRSPGCTEPETLVEALLARGPFAKNVEIVHLIDHQPRGLFRPHMEGHFRHNAMFVGPLYARQ
jgi:hypothetical protein